MKGHNELSSYNTNGSFALPSCPLKWAVSVSLSIVRLYSIARYVQDFSSI